MRRARGMRLVWATCVVAVLSVVAVLLVPAPVVSAAPNPGERVVVVDGSSATLSWGEVAGATTYQVRELFDDGSSSWLQAVSVPTFTDDSYVADDEYLVRYRLAGSIVDVECELADAGGADPAPGGVVVPGPGECFVSVDGTAAALSWGAIEGISLYQIRSGFDVDSFRWQASVDDATTWVNEAHSVGEQYQVRHRVNGVIIDIACTVAESIPDPDLGPEPGPDPEPEPGPGPEPGPVGSECVFVVDGSSATLSWGEVAGVTTYQVRELFDDGSSAWLAAVAGSSYIVESHVSGDGYLVRYRVGGVQEDVVCGLDDDEDPPAPVNPVEPGPGPADPDPGQTGCVALQRGIPLLQPGDHFQDLDFGRSDFIWPSVNNPNFFSQHLLWGYMWIPDFWAVDIDGYISLLSTAGRQRNLEISSLAGVGFIPGRTDHQLYGTAANGHARSAMNPISTIEGEGGKFILLGMQELFGSGRWASEATFTIEPWPGREGEPFVPQPCVVFEDIVPGYGPNYEPAFDALGITDISVRDALVLAHQVVTGCVAAVGDFFEGVAGGAAQLQEFIANPEAFIAQLIADIEVAVDAAVADPENAVDEVLRAVLQLDLLAENPAQWVGSIGCQIAVDVLTGVAAARLAERVLDFVRARRADIDGPRLCTALRSFSADTEVLLADGTAIAIADVVVGDVVFAHGPETGQAGAREVLATWPHTDTLVEFEVGDGTVTTTEDHEFWNVTDQAWQETQHIDVGDLLLTADGATVEAGTLLWDTAHLAPAFDLTIDEIHAYHVTAGDESVLVHNNDDVCEQFGITQADFDALQDYTGTGSAEINQALRDGTVSPDIQDRIDALEAALSQLDEFDGALLERGTGLPEEVVQDLLNGQESFFDEGFLSTSTDPGVVDDFLERLGEDGGTPTRITIESPPPGGRVIPDELSANPGESEVLFPPGTEFDVVSAELNELGELELLLRG